MKAQNWRCYICGKPLGKRFCLTSMSDTTDRVFLTHEDCSEELGDSIIITIKIIDPEVEDA